jgi:signal transduction histidine kinase
MKTEFVTLAAHQLRTPLSGIKWALRLLIDEGGELPPLLKEGLEKAYSSNERMINLVNDLLNATRIEEGRYVYKPVPGDFQKLVDDMVQLHEDIAKKKNVTIHTVKPPEGLPLVAFDQEKMVMAVQNLVDNAVKYTPKGGTVTVTTEKKGETVHLSVQDTGVGIPAVQKDRIFSKFFRAENVMRMETVGNGLGLFIAKNIVESHQGTIWFESELGKGTTFYISLPIAPKGQKGDS